MLKFFCRGDEGVPEGQAVSAFAGDIPVVVARTSSLKGNDTSVQGGVDGS